MADLSFDNVGVAALACAVPGYIQKIDPETSVDPDYARSFQKQTGVRERHISLTEQTCVDLAYAAALKALGKAGWAPRSLDALVFMSQTPDYNTANGNAILMQYRLGLAAETLAFDITLGCSSFPYGLSVCAALLQQEKIKRVMMLSGDTYWSSYSSKDELLAQETFLFGEGGTALLVENQAASPLRMELYTDGSGYKHMFSPFGGAKNCWRYRRKVFLPNGVEYIGPGTYMDGLEITSFSTTTVVDSIRAFLAKEQKNLDDYDALVLHQANQQIIKTIAKRLKIGLDKVPISLDRYGNTSGASTSLTIADAFAGSAREKLKLLTCAFGIGLSWGIAALEIAPAVIEPIFAYEGRFEEGFVKPAD